MKHSEMISPTLAPELIQFFLNPDVRSFTLSLSQCFFFLPHLFNYIYSSITKSAFDKYYYIIQVIP